MRTIPQKTRKQISEDPFYDKCIHERFLGVPCESRITIEHAWIYAGRQINDLWALVPCSIEKNVGVSKKDKEFNQYIALLRCRELGQWEIMTALYPKKNWIFELDKLRYKFRHLGITL